MHIIFIYKKTGDEYSLFQTHEPSLNNQCGFIIEGKPNELVVYVCNHSEKKYGLNFFDYESKKVVKSLAITMIEPELSSKLSENMIAIPFYSQDNEYGYAILLVDCIKREIIKTFEINRAIEKYKLRVMTI